MKAALFADFIIVVVVVAVIWLWVSRCAACLPAYNTSDPYGLFELGFGVRPSATASRIMQF